MPDGRPRRLVAAKHGAFAIDEMIDVERRLERLPVMALLERARPSPPGRPALLALIQRSERGAEGDVSRAQSDEVARIPLAEQEQEDDLHDGHSERERHAGPDSQSSRTQRERDEERGRDQRHAGDARLVQCHAQDDGDDKGDDDDDRPFCRVQSICQRWTFLDPRGPSRDTCHR